MSNYTFDCNTGHCHKALGLLEMASIKGLDSFVSNWQGKTHITSEDFLKTFRKYDADENGFIEGSEVDRFLEDLMSAKNLQASDISALQEFKEELFSRYDKNKDRKIELAELAKILPTEDNFLMQFRIQCSELTSVDFMQIWKHYDSDRNGYLETTEVQAFCYDLLSKKKGRRVKSKALEEFSQGIIELYDKNKDGKLEIRELQKLMPVEKNYLSQIFQKQKDLTEENFNVIFDHYDQNEDGFISEHELSALIRDLTIHSGKTDNPVNVKVLQRDLMKHIDKNKDGKIQRNELSILFTQKKALKIWK
ncbi:calretinin-like isoform X2 [Rhopilema esculentum]|uniref:calretinin-like isoform X2 n=1 Tax=Rhopilema esculentum TaxID=499914 RepID=UPI0031D4B35E